MNSTAIECKLIRAGGTRVTIESTEYHFAPYTDGAHVCEIENEEHADRFLSITEGYRLYRGEGKPVDGGKKLTVADVVAAAPLQFDAENYGTIAITAREPDEPAALNICTNLFEPEYTIHGTTYALLAIAQRAQIAMNISTEAWNGLTDIERSDAIEAELNAIDAAGPVQEAAPPAADERETLVAQYVALYGKKPHYTATVDKLRDLIAAKQ